MAMYVFHSSLNSPSPRDPQPIRRWDAGGADDVLQQQQQRQQRLPVDRLDSNMQAAFDNIRELDQQREHGHEPRDDVVLDERLSPTLDVNIPASCNASAIERRRLLGDDFIALASVYLLSAFWDERPNDFDNRHNGTLIRLMSVVREGVRNMDLVCEFGSHRTPISLYEMCENHHRPYGSFILSCHVPDDVPEAPCFVTVASESATGNSRVDVPVRTLRPQAVSHSFSVCVPPLFGDVPSDKLVEFFEVRATLSLSKKYRVSLILLQVFNYSNEPM